MGSAVVAYIILYYTKPRLVAYMDGIVVAYIILYYTIPRLVAYMGGQQRETAGSVQDWEER